MFVFKHLIFYQITGLFFISGEIPRSYPSFLLLNKHLSVFCSHFCRLFKFDCLFLIILIAYKSIDKKYKNKQWPWLDVCSLLNHMTQVC